MTCISCKKEHHENFCPNCGEKAGISRITFFSVFEEAFSIVANMDKGILFNLKQLTVNPKPFVSDYLHGKRKGIYNPIAFLILSITIYLILDGFIDISFQYLYKIILWEIQFYRTYCHQFLYSWLCNTSRIIRFTFHQNTTCF